MNIHVPEEIRIKYPQYEFRGKQREMNNRIVIEAKTICEGKLGCSDIENFI